MSRFGPHAIDVLEAMLQVLDHVLLQRLLLLLDPLQVGLVLLVTELVSVPLHLQPFLLQHLLGSQQLLHSVELIVRSVIEIVDLPGLLHLLKHVQRQTPADLRTDVLRAHSGYSLALANDVLRGEDADQNLAFA